MLETFRNASQSWIIKVLFALLALSFMLWGVGDMLRRGIFGTPPAIVVGHTALSAADVNREFKQEIDRLQPMFGNKLTPDMARKMGLMERTIDTIVSRTLVDEAGRKLGLAASDDAILREVAANPNLRDSTGRFDRQRLDEALARMGLSEDGFMALQRAQQIRDQVAEAVSGGVAAPTSLVDRLLRRRKEQRVAETVVVPDSAAPQPAAPDQATLAAYYKAHTQDFMAPEYRALTVMLLRPADVQSKIKITQKMLEDAYQQRRGDLNTPERRKIEQVLIDNQADADKAAALVKKGKSLSAVAKALGRKVVDLGDMSQADLPPELGRAVFAAAPGHVSAPIKTQLGWHVFKVDSVTPAHTRSLADVKGQLTQELVSEKAGDLLNDLSDKVEDALGGGATMEEAAKRFHLTIIKVPAVDSKGEGRDGKPVAGLPKADSFLDVAFHADVNDESQMNENPGNGYYMVRVDSVTPPAPKPLAQVKDQAVAAWQAERRHDAAHKLAEKAAEELKAGTPAAKVARQLGGRAATTEPFTRDAGDSSGLPAPLVDTMFADAPGAVGVGAGKAQWVAARLERVIPFDPAAHPEAVKDARAALAKSISGDVVDQYLAALNAKFGVTVNRAQLNREE